MRRASPQFFLCSRYTMPLAVAMFALMPPSLNAQVPAQKPATAAPSSTMPMAMPHMQKSSTGSEAMMQSMTKGIESMQKMPMSGDVDKDFAMMMKAHHQQGVDMAEMQIKHGKSAKMKSMAKNIIAAQNKEIAEFEAWLATQK